MKRIMISIIILASLFYPESKSFAQLDSLTQGSHIRLTAPKYFFQEIICIFEKMESDSIFVRMNSKTFAIPIEHLQKNELTKGKKRHTTTRAIHDSVFSGLIFGVLMHSEGQKAEGFSKVEQPGFWGGFASGALLVGSVSALMGYNIRSDRWEEITFKSHVGSLF